MPPPNRNRHIPSREPARQPHPLPPRPQAQILAPWMSWDSLAVRLNNLPKATTTFVIWQALQKEGRIFSIDLFEDFHGKREPKGKVRFKPPPTTDFWRNGTYAITLPGGETAQITIFLDNKCPDLKTPSPIRPDVLYPAEVKMPILSMDIGVLFGETILLPMRRIGSNANEHASVVLDLKHRAMIVYFQLPIFNTRHTMTSANNFQQEYRLKIPFVQFARIYRTLDSGSGAVSHLTFLDSPPVYHRRIKNIATTFVDETSWRDWDMWYRQASIVHNPEQQSTLPVSLKRIKPVIDIGRWNAFKITFSKDRDKKGQYSLLCDILKDYNVKFEDTHHFTNWDESKEMMSPIWSWIDLTDSKPSKPSQSSLEFLIDQNFVPLSFPVRYQLEVCISHGYLSEFNMTREFAVKLSELEEAQAKKLLEHVATKKVVYYDPMKIFDLKFIKGATDAKIPPYCCYMRSARITPSTVYFNTPTVDISNRIIRRYVEYADRFLRVRFTDEKLFGRINSTPDDTMNEVFTRVKRALGNGIVIGDRRYEFLAFGNSQFREHGAYFFAPLPNLTAANIRAWMGHFSDIRNVAKHAARLGQCFSTTRAISGCPVEVRNIDDVERNGYLFSDGVGRISRFLAQMIMSELKIRTLTGDPPSAFQFRLGGCKGMLAVSPEAQRNEVHIRTSQSKFSAIHSGLEVIRWSQYSIATLNRQLILVLSSLGIKDRMFHIKLKDMLQGLNEALESDSQATYWLKKYVDPNQRTLIVSQMVLDGFRRTKEPFMTSILNLWRAWHLKYLKEKAKIAIDKGACLLGCMDESGTLNGYFAHKFPGENATLEERTAALPEIFVQVSRPDHGGKYEVIEGLCILARNPSLHPGDIRVVKAVNVPQLAHLRDVVVLPQTGDRDIASMCSGGDLDGDDYLVIWDPDLIPNEWFCMPMKYTSNKARDLDHDVTVQEITSFFVTYMKNDSLPKIAHAHLAWADRLDDGVNEEKCIKLAQLHSDAVDYNKTGNPAVMTHNLQPRMWPHFMEKLYKPKDNIYHSGKILGQLYDAVERIDFVPSLEMPFDQRILDCQLEVSDDIYEFAKELKVQYDEAMRRIMAQHEIKTEFEVWSTFVLSHSNMSKDYKFHEEIGGISLSLNERFRKECYNKVKGHHFEQLAPLAIAMYRVTHKEMTATLQKYRADNPKDDKFFHQPAPKMSQLPLISFPWVLPHILGKIAIGHYEAPEPVPVVVKSSDVIDLLDANLDDINLSVSENRASTQFPALSSAIEEVHEDPFGLFADERVSSTPSLPKADLESGSNASGLDQLIDFGLFETPNPPSPSRLSSSAHANEDIISLLDLSESPGCGGIVAQEEREWAVEETVTAIMDERAGNRCIELVDEDDVEPTALDKLNELLGL